MKRLFVLLVLLSIFAAISGEGLVFEAPIALVEHPNLRLTNYCRSFENGNNLLVYTQMHHAESTVHIQLLSSDNEMMWDEALIVQDLVGLEVRPDDTFSLIRRNNALQPVLILDTYDQDGAMLENLSGIGLSPGNSTTPILQTDSLGGLRVLSYSNYCLYYHYVSPAGAPVYELSLPYENRRGKPGFATTQDQGFLVASSIGNGFRFTKLNANHTAAWTREYMRNQDTNPANLRLRACADGSVYFIWEEARRIFAQKMNANGDLLWTEPWVSEIDMFCSTEAAEVDQAGNLLLHYHKKKSNNTFGVPFYHGFDVISPEGNSIQSFMIGNLPDSFNYTFLGKILFDDHGGWYYIGHSELTGYPHVFVQHYDVKGMTWPQTIILPTVLDISGYSLARLEEGELKIIYAGVNNPTQSHCGIYAQKIDISGNLLYPDAGHEILGGVNSRVVALDFLGLKNGGLFACWTERGGGNFFYQLLKPDGEKHYDEAQSLLLPANTIAYTMYETDAGDITFVADTVYQLFLQKLNLETGTLWGAGRYIIGKQHSWFDNALYVANILDDSIYLQRFEDGEATWEEGGKLIGALRDDYQGSLLSISGFKDNCLIWSQKTGELSHMSFLNFFEADGTIRYSPQAAPILAELTENDVGCSPDEIFRHDNGWTIRTMMLQWDWVSDPGQGHLYGTPFYVVLDANAQPLCAPVSSYSFQKSVFRDNVIYGNPFANTNAFYKHDLLTNTLTTISMPDIHITDHTLLEDGRVLWYGKDTAVPALHPSYHYGFIDIQNAICIPADSYISQRDLRETVCTDYGVYFVWGKPNNTPYVQYLALRPWEGDSNPQDHTPALELELYNYPNPFNPSTNIRFTLPEAGHCRLEIYNMKGQKVSTLMDAYQPKGKVLKVWEGLDARGKKLPSGVYFCRLKSGKHTQARKMMLMK